MTRKVSSDCIVLPVVDLINPASFDYSSSMVAKSGFDWGLTFKWIYLPWEYFETPENNVKPFDSPAMPGGLLAMRREYFVELGEYDMGMEIWGSENIELSLKAWLCGGRVVVAPCSRVGHVFRMRRPYSSKPGMDTALYNAVRVAKTWLGEYEKNFFASKPRGTKIVFGDISENKKVKERLKCKDMKWFIENVYPELAPKVHDEL
uniref:Galactosyltransferase C-terminal domain-containing protein n=1 Tax=Caenorhabditis japonica TaxID=281687 RepID=A0A8R1HQT8_CAEJA